MSIGCCWRLPVRPRLPVIWGRTAPPRDTFPSAWTWERPLLRATRQPRSSPARGQQCTGSPRLLADLENVVPLPIGKPSLGPGAACPRLCGDWREKSVDSTLCPPAAGLQQGTDRGQPSRRALDSADTEAFCMVMRQAGQVSPAALGLESDDSTPPPPAASPTGTRSPRGRLRPHPQDKAMQLEEIQGPPSGQLTVQGGAEGASDHMNPQGMRGPGIQHLPDEGRNPQPISWLPRHLPFEHQAPRISHTSSKTFNGRSRAGSRGHAGTQAPGVSEGPSPGPRHVRWSFGPRGTSAKPEALHHLLDFLDTKG